jgi:hypothetical protein
MNLCAKKDGAPGELSQWRRQVKAGKGRKGSYLRRNNIGNSYLKAFFELP